MERERLSTKGEPTQQIEREIYRRECNFVLFSLSFFFFSYIFFDLIFSFTSATCDDVP